MNHPKPVRVLLFWSSGKDSAWALSTLRAHGYEVVALLTTVNMSVARVAVHGVRCALLDAQADALELPLIPASLPSPCSNDQYEQALNKGLKSARKRFRINHLAFGDLFLDDIRAYREKQFARTGLKLLFPLWGLSTSALAHEIISQGVRAMITCVDPKQLPAAFAGRHFDTDFLADLPKGVDPCGERGEFHTFVWDGPMFSKPVPVQTSEILERDGFIFADLTASK